MPKLKTKSSVKKRFKITGTGKVLAAQACKRHNMRRRSKEALRKQRGMAILSDRDAPRIIKFFPYGDK